MTKNLTLALNEKDVENTYRHNLLKKFKDMEITSPFGCDGFGVSKSFKLRTLMEFKDDLNLSEKTELSKVLCQSIFYIKRFYDKGIIPPSTIFIADRNECTVLHVNDVIKYLEMDIDWSVPPSQAHTITELFLSLTKDEKIKPFIYNSDDFDSCIQKIKDLTDNIQRKVLVTDKNITEVFRYFDEKVLVKNKFTTNERANLFVQILVNKDDNYLHPVKKRKTVVSKALGEVPVVSREAFESFFAHFSSSYTPSQKHKLAAVVDRIVEDTTRRKQGEFFTPAIWVDKAHEYIASVFGEDWRDKYVVWDPAWGTGNLTRDYKFKELYCSTLIQADIDTANQMGYNPEAVKFQYDFLNDEYEKLPLGLRNAIESGKEIIVLMNPPYATSSNFGETAKKDASKTVQNTLMISEGWGKSAQNLYAQFLFRITKLNDSKKNIKICLFSPSLFLTGTSFVDFRKKFLSHYGFEKGFLFEAKNFSEVSEDWGINFICFNTTQNIRPTILDVLEVNENIEIVKTLTKELYNLDNGVPANKWVREKLKGLKTNPNLPQMKNSLVIYEGDKKDGSYVENSLGYFLNASNSVDKNSQQVALWSVGFYNGHGVSVIPKNFKDCVSLFAARKIIQKNWVNSKDEYLKPNLESPLFNNFSADSIIVSLFHIHAYQTSIRKDDISIKNEFFWMSADKMKELADQNGYDELYNDARTSSDRYVYKLLFGEERIYDKLSPDAKAVLDKATELVERSMELRQVMANDENHLNSWDAGYAQLKLVWKEYFQEDFKEFRQLYKNLEDRMRPLVYELGFLKK